MSFEPLPYNFIENHGVLAEERQDGVYIYHHKPLTLPVMQQLRRFYPRVELHIQSCSADEFSQHVERNYQSGAGVAQLADNLDEALDLDAAAAALDEPEDLLATDQDAPIIRLINALFSQAIKEKASDIHIETYEKRVAVRFRVDGLLREVLSPQRAVAPYLISRIKVMAGLDIAEKRLPQDGRIMLRIAGRAVDVRVSTLPTGYQERVVMRILDQQSGRLSLDELGMQAQLCQEVRELIQRPYGMILVTGPTGSGKTTTLYACLNELNARFRNIMTVEDPIEYQLDGISQTPVNRRSGMDFAKGLRAILRQDPDVVMVGEIRDSETADIAIQAALTGHLVFSTLHTNTAIGAIARLSDMGPEPFLISQALLAVMGQRLVRRLCPHCKQNASSDDPVWQEMPPNAEAYRAQGCPQCNHSGYRGRQGIYELLTLNDELRSLIHQKADEGLMQQKAPHYRSMYQDGLRLVSTGITSYEELLRVMQSHSEA